MKGSTSCCSHVMLSCGAPVVTSCASVNERNQSSSSNCFEVGSFSFFKNINCVLSKKRHSSGKSPAAHLIVRMSVSSGQLLRKRRNLLPFSEILNMPGIPELLVADPKGIDGIVTIKQTHAVVGGVTGHPMECPDHYALIFCSYLAVAPSTVLCVGSGCRVCCSLFSSSRDPLTFLCLLQWSTIVAHQCLSPVHGGVIVSPFLVVADGCILDCRDPDS